jgi:Uma2 family endonuclease
MQIQLDLGAAVPLDPSVRLRMRLPELSDDDLAAVCQRNESWRFEREPNGELTVRPRLGAITGLQVAALSTQLEQWAESTGEGVVFGPTVGMCLPNGAMRSPSAAWLSERRWDALRPAERSGFLPFCADFVAEMVSPFDDRGELLDKMLEYRECGARLAWLIDPATRTVDVFRPREPVRTLAEISHLMERADTAAVLPAFVLDLRRIWNAGRGAAELHAHR